MELKDDVSLIQESLQGLDFKLKTMQGRYIAKRLIDLAGNMLNLVEIEEVDYGETNNSRS